MLILVDYYCYFELSILNISVLISKMVNIDRYNLKKQKHFGVLY